jgi:hypothetical protein
MDQSPFWEAGSRSVIQQIPRIFWKAKVHRPVHNIHPWATWIQPTPHPLQSTALPAASFNFFPLLRLLFDPEDGADICLRNVG